MSSSEAFINSIIIPFLRGQKIFKISLQMKVEDATKESFKACLIYIADDNSAQKIHIYNLLIKIFTELNITDPIKQKSYIDNNENLYELLIHLYRDGHNHLGKLITLIKAAKPHNNSSKWLIPAFIIGFLSFAGAIFERYEHTVFIKMINSIKYFVEKAVVWIKDIMSVARNAAVFGMITNSIGLIFTAKQITNNDLLSKYEKAYELFFACLTTFLTFTAYIVSFASSGAMTVLAGLLFVASSCVDIIKASISLVATHRRGKDRGVLNNDMTAIEMAQHYRKLYDYRSQRAQLILKVCTTVLTSLCVAAWTFFPPSLALTIGCIGAMIVTQAVSGFIASKMNHYYNENLQLKIADIDGIKQDNDIELTETEELLRQKLSIEQLSTLELSQAVTTVTHNPVSKTINVLTKIPASMGFFTQLAVEKPTDNLEYKSDFIADEFVPNLENNSTSTQENNSLLEAIPSFRERALTI